MVPAVLIGYVLGAIPSGVLVGRWWGRVDLREHGSRRTGSTNALRVLGPVAGAAVLLLDLAKGVAAVLIARWLTGGETTGEWAAAAAGVAAIIGHSWSVFIRFSGGRGVATAGGAIAAMSPPSMLALLPIVGLILWRTRYVSLASIVAALSAPLITGVLAIVGWTSPAAVALGIGAAVIVTARHADNIGRLRNGTERRLGDREPVTPT